MKIFLKHVELFEIVQCVCAHIAVIRFPNVADFAKQSDQIVLTNKLENIVETNRTTHFLVTHSNRLIHAKMFSQSAQSLVNRFFPAMFSFSNLTIFCLLFLFDPRGERSDSLKLEFCSHSLQKGIVIRLKTCVQCDVVGWRDTSSTLS